jgi:Lrp/AsnC family transcriptional regulator for asnA, asnC and gidA
MMKTKIDDKDLQILDILHEHAEYTIRQIAKKALLPPTTVLHRLKKLKELGVIKRYTIETDRKKLGKTLSAYVLISVDLKSLKEKGKTQYDVAKALRKIGQIEKVDIVTGESADIIVRLHATDIEDFNSVVLERIHLVDGVAKTTSMIIMSEQ